MRGTNPPWQSAIKWQSNNIQPTNDDNNPNSKDLACWLFLVTCPFAVTLVASLGMEGKSMANELLDAWFESAPDILSDKFEQSMNQSTCISLSVRATSSSEIPMPPLSSPSSPCYRREPPKRICVGRPHHSKVNDSLCHR
jgi:hypothetical protein